MGGKKRKEKLRMKCIPAYCKMVNVSACCIALRITSPHMKNSLLFWNPLAAIVDHHRPRAHLSFVRDEAKLTPSPEAAKE